MSRNQWIAGGLTAAVAASGLVFWGVTSNWTGDVSLGVGGLFLSTIGFFLAVMEARRARTASERASRAVDRALKAVAAGRLAISITQLRQLVVDLEEADGDDARHSRRILNSWRYIGQDAEGLITRRFGKDEGVLRPLRRSVRAAGIAKAALSQGDEGAPAALNDCLETMNKATDALGPMTELLTSNEEGDSGH